MNSDSKVDQNPQLSAARQNQQVDQPQTSQPLQSEPVFTNKSKNKSNYSIVVLILVVILSAAAAGAAVYFWQQTLCEYKIADLKQYIAQMDSEIEESTESKSVALESEQDQKQDDAAPDSGVETSQEGFDSDTQPSDVRAPNDKQRYTDDQGVYSFTYPRELIFNQQPDGDGVSLSLWGPTQEEETGFYDGISLQISDPMQIGEVPFDQYVEEKIQEISVHTDEISDKLPISIANSEGYTFTTSGMGQSRYYYLRSPDEVWAVEIIDSTIDPTNQGFEEVVQEILASFNWH